MSNISAIPVYNLQSVSDSLRQLANRIDDGQVDAARCVVALESKDGEVSFNAFGQDFTLAHAAGLCFAVMKQIV